MSDRYGTVDLANLIRLLAMLAENRSADQIEDALGISHATYKRWVRAAREQGGCQIEYVRGRNEYRIVDWGVFNRSRLLRMAKQNNSPS
jgi:biotin operon repressor